MLLREKMRTFQFSNSESIVIDYILNNGDVIRNQSINTIAKKTHTSPPLLIRIAKKLGYNGWVELRNDYLQESVYLEGYFQDIDPNKPFNENDSLTTIASKIVALNIESAKDTLSLIEHDSLQKAVYLINQAHTVKLYGTTNILFAAQEFKNKMRHIQKPCIVEPYQDEQAFEANISDAKDCAIIISYSGETIFLKRIISILKKNHVPIILLSSIGENSLSILADVTLHITTREKSSSKISGFTSLASIHLLLDILYSGVFSLDYQNNFNKKTSISKDLEIRVIHNDIIKE